MFAEGSTQPNNSGLSVLSVLESNANSFVNANNFILSNPSHLWVRVGKRICLLLINALPFNRGSLNSMFKDYFQWMFINYALFAKTKDKILSKDFWSAK